MVQQNSPGLLALGNGAVECALKVAPEKVVQLGSAPIIKMRTQAEQTRNNNNICYYQVVGQSLIHLLVHAIFSTKDRRPYLRSEEIRKELYAYMAGTLKNLDCHPIKIGGVEDHVHVFFSLSKNISFSDLIGRLKGSSSKRLKEKGLFDFAWQNGYGAFSVSESNIESVTAYILNQAEHHKKFSYQEEIREIFKRHRVAFDERYVWD